MTIFQAIFLSIIQGLTEFLPVSSSGHLAMFQILFGFTEPPVYFDVLLHLGSLLAITVFLRHDILDLIINWRQRVKYWLVIVVGSIPAGLFGFWLSSQIESAFNSATFIGLAFLITGFILLSVRFIKSKATKKEPTLIDGIIIGCFQALAIFPGISRSGSTISGALWRGFSADQAFRYSFLLSIPAILGAAIVKLNKVEIAQIGWFFSVASLVGAVISSYLSMLVLKKVMVSNKIYCFAFYCFFLGLLILTVIRVMG